MGTKILGSAFGDFKAYFEYETSSTNTTYSIKVTDAGMYQSCTYSSYPWKTTMEATNYSDRSGTDATATLGKGYHSILEEDKTYSYKRKTSAYTVTIKATTKKNVSGGSSGSVSKTFTVPALTKYTISYNANGGSGAPGATYKYYGIAAALSSTKPTRIGYTFLGWSTSPSATSATWSAGGSYTTNASDTLYAVWKANTYTVTFNANGGTNGTVTSKTKTYDKAMTLPTAAESPTKQYHNFLGWSTSPSATSATWSAGGTYSTNITSDTTLYAVWEEAYVPATMSQPLAIRVNGNNAEDDEGLYGRVSFTWAHGTMEGANVTPTSIVVYVRKTGTSTWYQAYKVTNPTATSINTGKFQCNGEAISTESQYDIKVILTDAYNSDNPLTATTFISKAQFTIDVNAAGDSVSIGEAASDDESELFNVAWDSRFKGNTEMQGTLGMGGQVKTSFKSSVAMGSYGAQASTVEGLVDELRFSSGVMGSASIVTPYTKGNVTISGGWYNYIYVPHRTGGLNGGEHGDNHKYGTLLLFGMTVGGENYRIRVASGAIAEVARVFDSSSDSLAISSLTVNGVPTKGNNIYYSNGTCIASVYYDSSEDVYYLRPPSSERKVVLGGSGYPFQRVYTKGLTVSESKIVCKPTYDGTTTYATNVYVGTTGIFSRTTNTSSRTIKHDVKELSNEDLKAENLYDLEVVQFKYNDGIITDEEDARFGKTLPGFLIEDMDQKYPIAVDKPSSDVKEWSWNAKYLIPPMLNLIQEQHEEIKSMKAEIEELKTITKPLME